MTVALAERRGTKSAADRLERHENSPFLASEGRAVRSTAMPFERGLVLSGLTPGRKVVGVDVVHDMAGLEAVLNGALFEVVTGAALPIGEDAGLAPLKNLLGDLNLEELLEAGSPHDGVHGAWRALSARTVWVRVACGYRVEMAAGGRSDGARVSLYGVRKG